MENNYDTQNTQTHAGPNTHQQCFFLLLFCHHNANKAAGVAARGKLVFPPAKRGHRKCDTEPREVVSISCSSLAVFILILIFLLRCFTFIHSFIIGTGCCRIEAPPPLSYSSLPPSSVDTLSLLAQSRNQFQSLFWVIITCWRTICWRRRGWRPATSRARTTHSAKHATWWAGRLPACGPSWRRFTYLFIYSQCTYYLLITRYLTS